jgi:hypothetical protein
MPNWGNLNDESRACHPFHPFNPLTIFGAVNNNE